MNTTSEILHKKSTMSAPVEPFYKVTGGIPLRGEIEISGAKNSALPAIVAASLSTEDTILRNVPLELNDVKLLIDLLRSVGVIIKVIDDNTLLCNGSNWTNNNELDMLKASKIRHSLLLLGASLSWNKKLSLPLPGGCTIGNRKHDLHVKSLREIGHIVLETEDRISVEPSHSKEKVVIDLHYPTFGGTLNIIFASVKLKSTTVIINNAARNPEVLDVIDLLRKMGAQIKWLDEKKLQIVGVTTLNGTNFQIMSDRIIVATIIAATGLTRGRTFIKNGTCKVLSTEVDIWRKAGLSIEEKSNGVEVKWIQPLKPVNIETSPYPGFHTDIQPLHTVLMSTVAGESMVKETILDGRFEYCYELNKFGANISLIEGNFKCVNGARGQIAKISGVEKLYGSEVIATDIRGGAAVVLAALASEGTSIIKNIYQIERGYAKLHEMLKQLGAKIERVDI